MKLVFITPGMTFGGAERVISILSNIWCDMGHEVSIFITATNRPSVYKLNNKINVEHYSDYNENGVSHFKLISSIRSFVDKEKPDCVFSFMNDVCAYTIFALMGRNIPIIYSERNDPNKTNQSKINKLFRRIVEFGATHIVFQTEGAKQCYSKKVQRKSSIILNPVELSRIPERKKEDINYSEIVTVARLEPQKNQELLIDAFNLVCKKHQDIVLKIYGEGSLKNKLQNKIHELGLNDKVLLMGAKQDVLEWIKESYCFVLTSDFEGLPNSLIEAMCMGIPCISTDCSPGGARQLLGDDRGLIVPCRDKERLAEAINMYLEQRHIAMQYGEEAYKLRDEVESHTVAKQWISLIEKIKRGEN